MIFRSGLNWEFVRSVGYFSGDIITFSPLHILLKYTVYGYFSRQAKEWVWKKVMDILRKKERKRQGRKVEPSAGGIDSQSVKSGIQGS